MFSMGSQVLRSVLDMLNYNSIFLQINETPPCIIFWLLCLDLLLNTLYTWVSAKFVGLKHFCTSGLSAVDRLSLVNHSGCDCL